jgi:hypothetical protein
MKNLSTDKMPQATYDGDVMGGSTVRGKAWGFLFGKGVYMSLRDARADFLCKAVELLPDYRYLVGKFTYYRRRLKNPVNLKTGKPLAQSTIKGFETRMDFLKQDLEAYKAAIKLSVLCGYLGRRRNKELSTEQRLIRYMLRDYVRADKELCKLKEEYQGLLKSGTKDWRFLAKNWEKMYRREKELNKELRKRLAFFESTTDPVKPKKKSRVNDIGLKLINGSKKFEEEQPPFAPHPQS